MTLHRLRRLNFLKRLKFTILLLGGLALLAGRNWFQPPLAYHTVGLETRPFSFPGGFPALHLLVALLTWQVYPPQVSIWFFPFAWAASLGVTSLIWLGLFDRLPS